MKNDLIVLCIIIALIVMVIPLDYKAIDVGNALVGTGDTNIFKIVLQKFEKLGEYAQKMYEWVQDAIKFFSSGIEKIVNFVIKISDKLTGNNTDVQDLMKPLPGLKPGLQPPFKPGLMPG